MLITCFSLSVLLLHNDIISFSVNTSTNHQSIVFEHQSALYSKAVCWFDELAPPREYSGIQYRANSMARLQGAFIVEYIVSYKLVLCQLKCI